ncbi:uncharacterized protein METZ01_LOCUS452696, partial [marine metagenome]
MLMARNTVDMETVKELILSQNGIADIQAGDVSNFDDFSKTITKTLHNWGTIDILVNNAGITNDNIIMRMKEDNW